MDNPINQLPHFHGRAVTDDVAKATKSISMHCISLDFQAIPTIPSRSKRHDVLRTLFSRLAESSPPFVSFFDLYLSTRTVYRPSR